MAKTIHIVDSSTGKISEATVYRIMSDHVSKIDKQWLINSDFYPNVWVKCDGTEHGGLFAFEDVEKAKMKAYTILKPIIDHHWEQYNKFKRIQRENDGNFGFLSTDKES